VANATWAVNVPECPPGQVGDYPDCHPPTCPEGQEGTYPDCHPKPDPTCEEQGKVGTYPDCHEPVETCAEGQLGTPPNCVTPLPEVKKPTNVIGAYDPVSGKLQIRLKCPAAFKPKCQGTAVAVTGKGKKAKVMSSKVKNTSKAGKWKLVTLTIKPAYRAKVEKMTAVNKKQLIVKQTLRSKKKKQKTVFHTYKVRVKG
jgi:hypothetical protein